MGGSTLVALSPLIGAPSTSNEGVANVASRDGTKVGGWSQAPSFSRQATIWTIANPTVPYGVPFLGTDDYGEIQALNSDGSLAAGYAQRIATPPSPKHAIIWHAANGTQDLATWLTTQYALNLTGWTLTDVKGMSGNGSVLAGNGIHNGSAEAWVVLLNVPAQAPAITQQPAARNICPGTTTTFTVAAAGIGTLAYQWQKNGENLSNGGHYSGTNTATLTVSNADASDAGNYRCVVSIACNSTTSNEAALTLKAATTITLQPVDQSVYSGETAYFTVAATGEGTVSYQWQKNGVDLMNGGHYSGVTTPTLTVSNVDAGDIGSYRCLVTAGCGTVTSNEVMLAFHAGVAADFDHDGDVDLTDFSIFQSCFNGPNREAKTGCVTPAADLDEDQDIDLTDFSIFQSCFNGPNRPAKPGCQS